MAVLAAAAVAALAVALPAVAAAATAAVAVTMVVAALRQGPRGCDLLFVSVADSESSADARCRSAWWRLWQEWQFAF